MLVKYGQAAILAALMVLAANAARAQETCPEGGFATGYAPPAVSIPAKCSDAKACCKSGDCCKDQKCCKDKDGCKCGDGCKGCACCKGKDGCKNCECGKSKACSKDCECCKNKSCTCGKDKESCACCKESGKCCCAAKSKQAKKAVIHGAIIIHVPMMPMCGSCIGAGPCVIHHGPPAPGCGGMAAPLPPPPPVLTPPGVPVPTMVSPVMPPQTVALPAPPPPPPACCPGTIAMGPVCVTPTKAGLEFENCLSILGIVGDLCCAHLHPTSLPAMCLSSLGLLLDLCPQSSPAPVVALPPVKYLQHPPQYVPPSSPFALEREREPVSREATLLPPPRPDCPVCPTANPVLPPPAVPCSTVASTPAAVMKVRIAAKSDSDQLEMSIGEDSCMSCKKMVVKMSDSEIKLTCLDGQVRIRGEQLKAKADCVCTDRKGGLVLEGDVVLSYKKDGQSARVIADHVELDLAGGSVTVKSAATKPASYTPERVHGAIVP